MKTVTVEQVIAWGPCGLHGEDDGENYTPARIREMFAGREALTTHDIAALDIPTGDKVWVLCHREFLTERQRQQLVFDFVMRVAPLCGDDVDIDITEGDVKWRLVQMLKKIAQ